MNWGSGSFGQIMTSITNHNDYDILFQLKEGNNLEMMETGTPLKCDDVIRLEHVNTQKNLHSHIFPSYITDSQEVTAFGNNGFGDNNDNWKVECYNWDKKYLHGSTQFFLKHVATEKYLYINIKKSLFNEYNCRNCPIMGHREVSAVEKKDKQSLWKVAGGVLYNSIANEEADEGVTVTDPDL
jgi:dolichyl-phosphate-mannose--protein O-mannosyl transferase